MGREGEKSPALPLLRPLSAAYHPPHEGVAVGEGIRHALPIEPASHVAGARANGRQAPPEEVQHALPHGCQGARNPLLPLPLPLLLCGYSQHPVRAPLLQYAPPMILSMCHVSKSQFESVRTSMTSRKVDRSRKCFCWTRRLSWYADIMLSSPAIQMRKSGATRRGSRTRTRTRTRRRRRRKGGGVGQRGGGYGGGLGGAEGAGTGVEKGGGGG
eukprot:768583-Hanusia_phi.AAC.5